jgi:hypothetical protein
VATGPKDLPERDAEDDAEARALARKTREAAEQGKLPDERGYLDKKLAEEKRKLQQR